jgi:hypothetical protein
MEQKRPRNPRTTTTSAPIVFAQSSTAASAAAAAASTGAAASSPIPVPTSVIEYLTQYGDLGLVEWLALTGRCASGVVLAMLFGKRWYTEFAKPGNQTKKQEALVQYASSEYLSVRDIRRLLLITGTGSKTKPAVDGSAVYRGAVMGRLLANRAINVESLRILTTKYEFQFGANTPKGSFERNPMMNREMLALLAAGGYRPDLAALITQPSRLTAMDLRPYVHQAYTTVDNGFFVEPVLVTFILRMMSEWGMQEEIPIADNGEEFSVDIRNIGIMNEMVAVLKRRSAADYAEHGYELQWNNVLIVEDALMRHVTFSADRSRAVLTPQLASGLTQYRNILLVMAAVLGREPFVEKREQALSSGAISYYYCSSAPRWVLSDPDAFAALVPDANQRPSAVRFDVPRNPWLTESFITKETVRRMEPIALLINELAFPPKRISPDVDIDALCEFLMQPDNMTGNTAHDVSMSRRVTDALVRKYAALDYLERDTERLFYIGLDYTEIARSPNRITPALVLDLFLGADQSLRSILYMGGMPVAVQDKAEQKRMRNSVAAFDLRCYLTRMLSVPRTAAANALLARFDARMSPPTPVRSTKAAYVAAGGLVARLPEGFDQSIFL